MKKLLVLIVLVLGTSLAAAQTPEPIKMPVPPAPAPAPAGDAAGLRKTCTDAMNADPEFAKSIITTVDKQIDQKTIDAHTQAAYHIAKDERHVILAYAAMWVIAAGFVAFLWLRQQKLKAEIAQLRSDLDAAAKGS